MPQWMNVTNFLTVIQTVIIIIGGLIALSNVRADMQTAIAVLNTQFSDLKEVVSTDKNSQNQDMNELRSEIRELVQKMDTVGK